MTEEGRESEAVDQEPPPRPRPQSITTKLWMQVERQNVAMGSCSDGFLDEVEERTGFLILRGLAPDDALEEALRLMHCELDAMKKNGRETLWWVVKAVASLFPIPWRRPSGNYTRRILGLAEIVEENARADAGLGSAYAREDVPPDHLGPNGVAEIEKIIWRRCEQISADRTTVPDEEYLSAEYETGEYR